MAELMDCFFASTPHVRNRQAEPHEFQERFLPSAGCVGYQKSVDAAKYVEYMIYEIPILRSRAIIVERAIYRLRCADTAAHGVDAFTVDGASDQN